MAYRISPLWWPVLGAASPFIGPMMIKKNRRFKENRIAAKELNTERMTAARPLDMPELDFMELTVLVEEKTEAGFIGDAGVSYAFRTDRGSLLFDVGFGPERPAMANNAARLDFSMDKTEALAISHLHPDHMGGLKASRSNSVIVPEKLGAPGGKPCFLPDQASAEGFEAEVITEPRLLTGGIGTTGPLARSLFFFGLTEEQALVADVKGKGLVVITGCGHPTIEVILDMVKRLSNRPVHAIGGGLHFPLTDGRGNRAGIQFQRIIGTGHPPWRALKDNDLSQTIEAVNAAAPEKVYLSAHDTCDFALERLHRELTADTRVLKAGATYRF